MTPTQPLSFPWWNRVLIALLFYGFSGYVLSDAYHYKDILIGDRAATLGGAYTAISNDTSGMYYNPAGLVNTSEKKVSASANAYNTTAMTYGNINDSGWEWTRKSSAVLANFFGIMQPFAGGMVGFSITIPDSAVEDQNSTNPGRLADSNFDGTQELEYNNEDTSTYFGPSFSYAFTPNWSLGITLYGYLRSAESILKQTISASDGTHQIFQNYVYHKQTDEWGTMPILGLMYAPTSHWSVGVTARKTFILNQSPQVKVSDLRNFRIWKNATAQTTTFEKTADASFYDYHASKETDVSGKGTDYVATNTAPSFYDQTERILPWQISAGWAYNKQQTVWSMDVDYYSETDTYQATWNAALGVEQLINDTWVIRGGLYTNNANTSDDVNTYRQDHVDLLGVALGLSRHTDGSSIHLGINYATGNGEASLSATSNRIQTIDMNQLSVFASTVSDF